MKHSPLQLLQYFVPEISFTANQTFNTEKGCEGGIEEFSVEAVAKHQAAPENFQGRSWSVEMVISQKLKDGQNLPYKFSMTLVGMFAWLDKNATSEQEAQFVRVNGSTILYATAREVIRSTTTLGPWGPVILPTLSFYDKDASKEQATSQAPKAE